MSDDAPLDSAWHHPDIVLSHGKYRAECACGFLGRAYVYRKKADTEAYYHRVSARVGPTEVGKPVIIVGELRGNPDD